MKTIRQATDHANENWIYRPGRYGCDDRGKSDEGRTRRDSVDRSPAEVGITMPLADLVKENYDAAMEQGWGEKD